MKIAFCVIKADVGGHVGHSESYPYLLVKASEDMAKAKSDGLLVDYHVTKCGDDLQLIMAHQQGEDGLWRLCPGLPPEGNQDSDNVTKEG